MWDWIVNILFELLKLIQTFAVDWGLSIIILVVIVRLLLTPLMLKSTKSTARMQVLQPKMLEIQERYADDPQRQAEEMQKFYSENKFNPLSGCLPLLIQMPILIAEELDSLNRSPSGRTGDMQRISIIIGDNVQINMGGVPSAANFPRMSAMPGAVVVPRREFCW